MARTRLQQQQQSERASFLSRHSNVYVYVPNLIGAWCGAGGGSGCAGRHGRWFLAGKPPHSGAVPSSPPAHCLPATRPCAGYARVATALYAFAVALHSPGATVLAYFASFVCDELDGRFARKFNQCSMLGSGAWVWLGWGRAAESDS